MQPQTAETPQYAKAGNAYETSTAKPVNPRGLYYNPGNGIYIGTTHEIQGDALIRQGYHLIDEGKHSDGRSVGLLTDAEIKANYKDGKKIVKKAGAKSSSKTTSNKQLKQPTDEFNTPEDEDSEDGDEGSNS